MGSIQLEPGVTYRLLWCVLAFIGSIYGVKLIWDISDFLIGLMVFPNIIGLLVLRRRLTEKGGID